MGVRLGESRRKAGRGLAVPAAPGLGVSRGHRALGERGCSEVSLRSCSCWGEIKFSAN